MFVRIDRDIVSTPPWCDWVFSPPAAPCGRLHPELSTSGGATLGLSRSVWTLFWGVPPYGAARQVAPPSDAVAQRANCPAASGDDVDVQAAVVLACVAVVVGGGLLVVVGVPGLLLALAALALLLLALALDLAIGGRHPRGGGDSG